MILMMMPVNANRGGVHIASLATYIPYIVAFAFKLLPLADAINETEKGGLDSKKKKKDERERERKGIVEGKKE